LLPVIREESHLVFSRSQWKEPDPDVTNHKKSNPFDSFRFKQRERNRFAGISKRGGVPESSGLYSGTMTGIFYSLFLRSCLAAGGPRACHGRYRVPLPAVWYGDGAGEGAQASFGAGVADGEGDDPGDDAGHLPGDAPDPGWARVLVRGRYWSARVLSVVVVPYTQVQLFALK
jgi:hypothetical protein